MCQADTPVTITKPAAEGPKKPAAAEGPEKPAAKASFRGLYRFADRRDAGLLVLGSLMVFISGANTPLQLVVFGRLLDSFNAADTSDVKERVHFYAMWYALLGVQQVITNSVQTSCFAAVAARQARQMRQAYFRALARRPMAFFDAQDAGALASSVMVKTTDVQNGLGDDLVKLAQQVLSFVLGLGCACYFTWELALVSLGAIPFLGVVIALANASFAKATRDSSRLLDAATSTPLEAIGSIRTVQALGREPALLRKYRGVVGGACKQGIKLGKAKAALEGTIAPIMFVMFGCCLWYGSSLVADDMEADAACRLVVSNGTALLPNEPDPTRCATGGNVMTAFLSVIFGFMGLLQAIPSLSSIAAARTSGAAIFAAIDAPADAIDAMGGTGDAPSTRPAGRLELVDVAFAYPARREVAVYRGLCLTVEAGQAVALAGPSGCGKSTLVALLERWYDVDGGAVLLDGADVRSLDVRWLRSQVGLVSQEPTLFAGSIGWNIGLGAAHGAAHGAAGAAGAEGAEGAFGMADEAAVVRAARLANAHAFVSELPDGYATEVGEKGVQLSGGQKQRIAIARALVREPALLVLDEATSALDAASERVVQAALDEIMAKQKRTSIVIAHRLSTIRNADKIAVFAGGRVVEEGPHDALLERDGGVYRALVAHSAAGDN